MDPVRPLRDVFADLASDDAARQAHAADPAGFLESYGHTELPDELVNQAIVNYADTAPPEIAEHLAPFVQANGPVPGIADFGHADGLGLLASAPAPDTLDLPEDGVDAIAGPDDHPHAAHEIHLDPADLFDLDFGDGHQPAHDPAHEVGHWQPAHPADTGTELGTDSDVTPHVGEPLHDLDHALADLDADAAHHGHLPDDPDHPDHPGDPDHPTDAGDWADH